ncbi:HNH endonuclease signature motif containing protein [Mycobacterium sp. 141]|uniref:HNH endonuclease signature motif containing protein n=1 Tax=Mycobacterium sp. 141 TaxID=1120797 RepID=UPI000374010D|nr:HNH endonuclease signature motif containing protein [Mycobacterium sp. 141]
MFDHLADAALIDGLGDAARAEAAAVARRLALIGELDARRERELAETIFWRSDPFEEVAAEVSAALTISRTRAGGQIRRARVLRDKLPQVAAVFAAGTIDYRVVCTIIARTTLVEAAVCPQLDAAVARHAPKWMRLSDQKLQDRVDLWVAKYDPAGVRIPPSVDESRHITVEPAGPGMALVWAIVHAGDGAGFDQRLDALAATVCQNDPRTHQQRRSDALGPLSRLEAQLPCRCGTPDCPATAQRAAADAAVVHVLAEQATVEGTSNTPGYLPGFGIQPAETVRELAATGRTTPVTVPTETPGYRPSAALRKFIRWRDLTCRFPGCDRPAVAADIDHTAPYPYGATHPSNLKLYCRHHHLVKTFCPGWSDHQLPDGTVVITSPTGHVYRTEPHGAALFPALAHPTGEIVVATPAEPTPYRALMMPTRTQTREQDRRDRVAAERRRRIALNTEQQRQHQAWLAANYQPPPF